MPTKQTTPPAPTLEERAARAAAELAEVQAEQQRRAQAEWDRLAEHQERYDAQVVENYPAVKADAQAAVEATRAALEAAIEADPVTVALVNWYAAQAHRRAAFDMFISARGRQGHDVTGAQYPISGDAHLEELRDRLAHRAATERDNAERAAHDDARATRPTEETQ